MNKLFYPVAAVLILAGSAFTFVAAQNWQIADGYSIAWSVSGSEAGGIFKTFTGSIVFDEQNPATAKFDVKVDAASVNTGNGLMNKHAKSDEWLDAAKFPMIQFVSRSISKTAGGYQVTGDLDLHGVKKTITIPFTFQKTAKGGAFTGSFTVNRSDYKIGKPGGDVGDQIKLDISVPVTKS
jgi:polyisoprenoid-binding protein YceI